VGWGVGITHFWKALRGIAFRVIEKTSIEQINKETMWSIFTDFACIMNEF